MKRFRHRLAIVLSMLGLAASATFMTAMPASAGVRGLDLQYSGCNAQAPGTYVVLKQWNVYGWRCSTGWWEFNIDMNRACRYTYGPASSAYFLDYSNPYSWRCR
jgi:hypothetical protein